MSSLCSRRCALLGVLAIVLLAAARGRTVAGAEEKSPVEAALDSRSNFALHDVWLEDVVALLRKQYKLEVRLDEKALDEVGVGEKKADALKRHAEKLKSLSTEVVRDFGRYGIEVGEDSPMLAQIRAVPLSGVSLVADGITLRSALLQLLRQFDPTLTYVVQDNIVLITTKEGAQQNMKIRVYPVADLALAAPMPAIPQTAFDPLPTETKAAAYNYAPLIDLFKAVIDPESWDDAGGAGSVRSGFESLTVAQTRENHEAIADLLTVLRKYRAEMKKEKPSYAAIPLYTTQAMAPREQEIEIILRSRGTLEIKQKPLKEVISALAEKHKILVLLDAKALDEVGIGRDTVVTFRQTDDTLHNALKLMLAAADPTLTYTIDHESLLLTTKEGAAQKPRIVLYPVQDIVAGEGVPESEMQDLVDMIKACVVPESWDEAGGSGAVRIDGVEGALVVSQSEATQHEIVDLLSEIRRHAPQHSKAAAPQPPKEPVVDKKKEADPYVTVVFLLSQPYDKETRVKEEDLIKLLKETVAPESWKNEEVSVRTLPSRLIIRQRKSVQMKVYEALVALAVVEPKPPASPAAPPGYGGLGGGASSGFGGGGFGGGANGGGYGQAGALPGGGK